MKAEVVADVRKVGLFGEVEGDGPRAALEQRWLALTRERLPAMAGRHGWPIHLDHCFMRVCLDAALGAPWTAAVKRPALHHMSDAQLEAAIRVAESIAARPDALPELNRRSLDGRRAARGAIARR